MISLFFYRGLIVKVNLEERNMKIYKRKLILMKNHRKGKDNAVNIK
ncbi:hypothetical protein [Crassaminicella profunda]|nr:hypothetical protein [Crassaminicella profunda]QZY56345.1 hypothetical protein K7H06_05010 [Crassaminicella profunda]